MHDHLKYPYFVAFYENRVKVGISTPGDTGAESPHGGSGYPDSILDGDKYLAAVDDISPLDLLSVTAHASLVDQLDFLNILKRKKR